MGKSKKFVGKKSGTAEKKASREMTVAEAAELVSCDESGYDAQLAALFPSVAWPHGSTAVDAAAIAAAPQMAGARFD